MRPTVDAYIYPSNQIIVGRLDLLVKFIQNNSWVSVHEAASFDGIAVVTSVTISSSDAKRTYERI